MRVTVSRIAAPMQTGHMYRLQIGKSQEHCNANVCANSHRSVKGVFTMTFNHTATAVQQLQDQIADSVVMPDDPGYEQARLGWNRAYDQRPAVILFANSADDVVAGVRFAREAGLGVSMRSTGHGMMQPADDNLLIVTSDMK